MKWIKKRNIRGEQELPFSTLLTKNEKFSEFF